MRKPLPSRTAVLELLATQDRALDARELADRLGVAPASQDGLLRILDNLVFDGVVTARGDTFRLGSTDKAPEKTSDKAHKPAAHAHKPAAHAPPASGAPSLGRCGPRVRARRARRCR